MCIFGVRLVVTTGASAHDKTIVARHIRLIYSHVTKFDQSMAVITEHNEGYQNVVFMNTGRLMHKEVRLNNVFQ